MSGKSPEIVALGECTFRKSYAGDTLNMLHMATKLHPLLRYLRRPLL